ncbi:hypothetical protein ABH908_000591 [Pseudomonas frederiksbergensis]|uniref:hypothetical protein n=1 Tax=Pseudomonas TaxID=286 RepID=UPI0039DF834E
MQADLLQPLRVVRNFLLNQPEEEDVDDDFESSQDRHPNRLNGFLPGLTFWDMKRNGCGGHASSNFIDHPRSYVRECYEILT